MPVAVLIVNYRAYDALGQCLASLDRVLDAGDEVVIVDHESNESELARVAQRCPRAVTIARADNPGFAAGVNLAARSSTAPYLLLLNPDTEMVSAVPRELAAWLDTHPATAIVGPRVLNSDGSIQPTARRFPGWTTCLGGRSTWLTKTFPNNWVTRHNLTGWNATTPVDVDWVSGACLMTRRSTFNELGGLDESFFLYTEDADYCRRAANAGSRCTHVPSVVVRHALGSCAAYAPAPSIRAFHASAYQYYWKHSGPIGRTFAPVVRMGLAARAEWRVRSAERQQPAGQPRRAPASPQLHRSLTRP